MVLLKRTLVVIAIVQALLGALVMVPGLPATVLGLEPAPEWVDWLFVMFGARSFGFAYGMWLAARDPVDHRSWIVAMIGIQGVDWIGTMVFLVTGAVTLGQVTTAAFLPVAFIVILAGRIPRHGQVHPDTAGVEA